MLVQIITLGCERLNFICPWIDELVKAVSYICALLFDIYYGDSETISYLYYIIWNANDKL